MNIFKTTLDTRHQNGVIGPITQFDNATLELQILTGGQVTEPWNSPEFELIAMKRDMNPVREVDQDKFIILSKEDHKVRIELKEQFLTCRGTVKMQLTIKDGSRLSTTIFRLSIAQSLDYSIIESIKDIKVLDDLNEVVESLSTLEVTATNNEAKRQHNEKLREVAESNRQDEFDKAQNQRDADFNEKMEEYQDYVSGLQGIQGKPGETPQIRVNETHIQIKYPSQREWTDLIALELLKGPQGPQGKQGETGEQGIQGEMGEAGKDGANGKDGVTPNIAIGTVTTLEPGEQATVTIRGDKENPILDIAIPRGADGKDGQGGGSGVDIDDSTISTEKTWSSSRIENFVLTNDEVVWTDVNGENVNINYTKEGYLREIEVWGNTIQDEEDLSNIQHLGELYVDDEGEPILDNLGREQYKVEVYSRNTVLINWGEYELVAGRFWNGKIESAFVENVEKNKKGFTFEVTGSSRRGVVVQGIRGFGIGKYTLEFDLNKYGGTSNGSMFANINTFKNGVFVEQANMNNTTTAKGIRHSIEFNLTKDFDEMWLCVGASQPYHLGKHGVENINLYKGNYCGLGALESHKTTILLPCQLMKVRNRSDRLYWDSKKGRYVIEKNIVVRKAISAREYRFDFADKDSTDNVYLWQLSYECGGRDIARYGDRGSAIFYNPIMSLYPQGFTNTVSALIKQSTFNELGYLNTDKEVVRFLSENDSRVVFQAKTPELIETDIREELKLPTFINRTYVSVNGGIAGSIKAKAPIDGGQAILSLSQKNTLLEQENAEIKAINQAQDTEIALNQDAINFMLFAPTVKSFNEEKGEVNAMAAYLANQILKGRLDYSLVVSRYEEFKEDIDTILIGEGKQDLIK